ncbi:MAG: thioredoxin family protein [Thiobacillus sp.]|nr:thioredoxin family protein [Thiobacillus sp.]MDP3125539.1 thioredoxin family protein [Thiobacillus sp.]
MRRLIAPWMLLLKLAILACGLALTGTASAADGLVQASNFKADGKLATQRRVPILVVFTSPGCSYCERVKREYLVPMHKDPAYLKRVIIREVTVGATTPLTGFDGSATTEGAFAASHKIFLTPTVKVLTPQGGDAGEAIVGMLTPDYYFGYLEAAIDEGGRITRGK